MVEYLWNFYCEYFTKSKYLFIFGFLYLVGLKRSLKINLRKSYPKYKMKRSLSLPKIRMREGFQPTLNRLTQKAKPRL